MKEEGLEEKEREKDMRSRRGECDEDWEDRGQRKMNVGGRVERKKTEQRGKRMVERVEKR